MTLHKSGFRGTLLGGGYDPPYPIEVFRGVGRNEVNKLVFKFKAAPNGRVWTLTYWESKAERVRYCHPPVRKKLITGWVRNKDYLQVLERYPGIISECLAQAVYLGELPQHILNAELKDIWSPLAGVLAETSPP